VTAPTAIRHVYVHAPFCARRCVYCDFAVKVDRAPNSRRWLAAVAAEFEDLQARGAAPLAPVLDTLYVGGGTPSLLSPRFATDLATLLGRTRTAGRELEWTVEANPESFGSGVAREWAAAGVNRVSLGVQSFDPGALKWMGRLHSPADARTAVKRARAAGVANVSIDLIFGLPDSAPRSWPDDLEQALALDAPHVSLYGLAVEKGTRLFHHVSEGRSPPPSDSRYEEEYLLAAQVLADAGYDHYEVSNFARPGFASRHNQAYWSGVPYLGLGNGAHSFHGGRRWWNERDWDAYAAAVGNEGDAASGSGRSAREAEVRARGGAQAARGGEAGTETLSAQQSRLEAIWLGLRTAKGLDLGRLTGADDGPANSGHPRGTESHATRPNGLPSREPAATRARSAARQVAQRWEARGLAFAAPDRIRLTPKGWLVLDALAVELDEAVEPRTTGTRAAGPTMRTAPAT